MDAFPIAYSDCDWICMAMFQWGKMPYPGRLGYVANEIINYKIDLCYSIDGADRIHPKETE
jgi:hypothetical protein